MKTKRPSLLRAADVRGFLERHPGWRATKQGLTRTYTFKNHTSELRFVVTVATFSKEHRHHPSIQIDFKKVEVRWTTHDAGGITDRDVAMAELTDRIFKERIGWW